MSEISTSVRAHLGQRSHTTGFSNNWKSYSNNESVHKADAFDKSSSNTHSSLQEEIDKLLANSNYKESHFQGICEVFFSQPISFFPDHN